MRLYTFCNYYLSSIQQGIQSAHVVHDLFVKYATPNTPVELVKAKELYDWATNHKTMVVLNGGNCESLYELVYFLSRGQNPFPWTFFNEDTESLGNALTCVGIVLPESIYEACAALRRRVYVDGMKPQTAMWNRNILQVPFAEEGTLKWNEIGPFTDWDRDLIERLNTYSLAR